MNWKRTRSAFVALAVIAARSASALTAKATTVNANIPVSGTFDATLGGSGTANLTSASGNYKQYIGSYPFGFYTNIGVSAPGQSVPLSIPTVSPPTMAATGNVDLDFDDVTPGTPQVVNAFNADLNGNTNIGFVINAGALNISVGSLGTFPLTLTVNGTITDIDFNSTGSSLVSGGNGGLYAVPGDFSITLNGAVTGVLNLGALGNLNLGTLFTIPSSTLPFSAALPGFATLTDLDGGLPPFPNDMGANFQALLATGIPVPLSLPISVNQSNSVSGGSSGFTSLAIAGSIDATLTLSNIGYNLDGQVNQVLVPEPGTLALGSLAMVGLAVFGFRRRKSA